MYISAIIIIIIYYYHIVFFPTVFEIILHILIGVRVRSGLLPQVLRPHTREANLTIAKTSALFTSRTNRSPFLLTSNFAFAVVSHLSEANLTNFLK
jgi:hypothetical protein